MPQNQPRYFQRKAKLQGSNKRILDLLPLPCVDIIIHSTHTIAVWDTSRAAVVHLNFRAGSTFPVPVCTVPSSTDRTSRCNKVDAARLYASYRLNLLLLKGQICVTTFFIKGEGLGSRRVFIRFNPKYSCCHNKTCI